MITVDTCTIIWAALDPAKLSKKAKEELEMADEIIFPGICMWEIAYLMKSGKLKIDASFENLIFLILASKNYKVKGMDPRIACLSVSFDDSVNKDPADRIIAATAQVYDAPLVTADKNLRKSKEIETIW